MNDAIPKLLLVGSALGGGGAETRFRLLAQHLFGGTADVAALKSGGGDVLSIRQRFHELGYAGPRSYLAVLRNLRRAVRAQAYDVVLAVGLYPNTLAWAALRGMSNRPALVMTEITRPYTESALGGGVRHLASHAVRRITYPGATLCAANSQDGLDEVVRHYRVRPDRIRRIPNLAQPERLEAMAAAGPAAEGESRSICAVSRLVAMKRVDTLIEAVAGLQDMPGWHVDVLGDGPDKKALQTLVSRHGLEQRVHLHGWVGNPYPAMKKATAVVLTSAYEGFSNTVLEAMVLGTPVVTSFCSSDARDMVAQGATLGFPVGDHLALRQLLARLLADAELRASLVASGRAYARRHTPPQALLEYEALVRDAMANRPGLR